MILRRSVKGHKNFTNWSDGFNEDVGNIFSSVFVFSTFEISRNFRDISSNLAPVVNKVFSKSWEKFSWFTEDSSPSLNLFNITSNIFAI